MKVVVEADGGSRGNPGPAGYGAVVLDPDSGAVLAERFGAIGITTNNVAEYQGLIAGLTAAAELGASEVDARMDSKLVVEQMSGRWQIKHPGLRPLAAQAADVVRRFSTVTFTWIPRHLNKRADALANRAMDGAAEGKSAGTGGKPAESADLEPVNPGSVEQTELLPRPKLAGPDSPGRPPARAAAAAAAAGVHQATAGVHQATAGVHQATAGVHQAGAGKAGAQEAGAGAKAARGSWEPPATQPVRLLLIRHGETRLTADRRYSGRGDVPLTDHGLIQAQAVAARVSALGVPLAAVLASPLERCIRTAEFLNAPVVPEPDLIECDFGVWEGLTFAEVRERWPDQMTAWLGSTAVAPPGGEPFTEVAQRVDRVLKRIRAGYPAGVVAVVSHVSPLKLILRDALAAGDSFLHRCYLDPAGLSIVDYWADGGVAVRTVNDTAHLR